MFINTDISHHLFKLIRRCLVNEHLKFKESKMKGKSALILTTLVTIIISGCGTTGQLSQSYQSSSPELDQYKREAISNDLPLFIGMTSDQVIAIIGPPYDINRSVGSSGVHKQWVYNINTMKGYPSYGANSCSDFVPTHFLYFKNRRLTGWDVR